MPFGPVGRSLCCLQSFEPQHRRQLKRVLKYPMYKCVFGHRILERAPRIPMYHQTWSDGFREIVADDICRSNQMDWASEMLMPPTGMDSSRGQCCLNRSWGRDRCQHGSMQPCWLRIICIRPNFVSLTLVSTTIAAVCVLNISRCAVRVGQAWCRIASLIKSIIV